MLNVLARLHDFYNIDNNYYDSDISVLKIAQYIGCHGT